MPQICSIAACVANCLALFLLLSMRAAYSPWAASAGDAAPVRVGDGLAVGVGEGDGLGEGEGEGDGLAVGVGEGDGAVVVDVDDPPRPSVKARITATRARITASTTTAITKPRFELDSPGPPGPPAMV